MEERRQARVGTVSGLALLAGGTAVAAVADARHSAVTMLALGALALVLGHSLLDEIRRQAGRRSGGQSRETVNAVLLAGCAVAALALTVAPGAPVRIRVAAAALTLGYASAAGYVLRLRQRGDPARPAGRTHTHPGVPARDSRVR